jgi:hypothetical protein
LGATSYSADLSCWCSGSVVVLKKLIKKFFIFLVKKLSTSVSL